MHLSNGSVQHGCILAVNKHQITVNQSMTDDDTIRRGFCRSKIKVSTASGYERTNFHKTVLID